MKKLLITGGTIFVSKFAAEYFVKAGYDVTVLNRNHHAQVEGVRLIEADRNQLGEKLQEETFDGILDINAYTKKDVEELLNSGVRFQMYVLISSSAVYPEYGTQPFVETAETAENYFWGQYGTDKIEAEKALVEKVPDAYIVRPPYLYGTYNDVYREAFVFDCALENRKFYLPGNGDMKLQFFHVEDLCRFMQILLEKQPEQRIFNVGNERTISIKEWVSMCYRAAGKTPEFVEVSAEIHQRKYFPFAAYEYRLDVTRQKEWMSDTKEIQAGIQESYAWYREHMEDVEKRPYLKYIDENLKDSK